MPISALLSIIVTVISALPTAVSLPYTACILRLFHRLIASPKNEMSGRWSLHHIRLRANHWILKNPPPNHHKPILYNSHPDQEITGRITVACDSDLCCLLNTCIGIPAALGGPRYTRNIKALADSAVCKIHTTPRISCFLVAHSETGAATRHKYLEIGRSVSRRSKSCLQAQIILQDILPTSPSLRERRRRKA